MTMNETIDLMLSEDRKERLKAEYWQTKNRVEKLDAYIAKALAGEEIEAEDSVDVLEAQGCAMHDYLYFLEMRMKMSGLIEPEGV